MKHTRTFTLERPAKKSGGDRYQEEDPGNGKSQVLIGTLYVNQNLSRKGGQPRRSLIVTIETED